MQQKVRRKKIQGVRERPHRQILPPPPPTSMWMRRCRAAVFTWALLDRAELPRPLREPNKTQHLPNQTSGPVREWEVGCVSERGWREKIEVDSRW